MAFNKLLLIPAAAALLIAGGLAVATAMTPPADLDYSLAHLSDHGAYSVELEAGTAPIPVGQMHSWTVAVAAPDGKPVEAEVVFDGGMPQHGHGLPTVPQVTGRDADGRYVVSGVRFNMPGWWQLKIHLDGTAGKDTATFNIKL